MKRLNTLLVAFFVFASLPIFAETEAEILTKIAQNGAKINTIESQFTQRKHAKALKNDITANGRFYYQKSDKVCMRYSRPQGDLLLMNGDDFVMIVGGKRNATNAQSNPMVKQMRTLLTACVVGDFERLKTGRNTKISVVEGENNYVLTVVFDGSAKKYFANVVLTFDKKSLALQILLMNEANGNFTEYRFEKPVFNQTIEAKIFDIQQK
jgi:outer membrane lipoprotein-sorting protein